MSVVAIHHVQLAMPAGGEERARAFYCDVLGLPERPKPTALAARGGCWFESAAVRIHLGVDAEFRPATKAHPALVVDALEPILDACRRHGFVVQEDAPLDGHARAYVRDPFGNRIELVATTAEPLASRHRRRANAYDFAAAAFDGR